VFNFQVLGSLMERRHVSFLDWVAILRLAVSRDRVRECRIVADEQADDALSDETRGWGKCKRACCTQLASVAGFNLRPFDPRR
jgi:hypothetical protein